MDKDYAEVLVELQTKNKKLNYLQSLILSISRPKGKQWVRYKEIMKVTGWNASQMQKARKNGLVDFKDIKSTNKGLWYDLNSINPLLLRL
jgi:hypothetical protein